jgi:hypothetical protein
MPQPIVPRNTAGALRPLHPCTGTADRSTRRCVSNRARRPDQKRARDSAEGRTGLTCKEDTPRKAPARRCRTRGPPPQATAASSSPARVRFRSRGSRRRASRHRRTVRKSRIPPMPPRSEPSPGGPPRPAPLIEPEGFARARSPLPSSTRHREPFPYSLHAASLDGAMRRAGFSTRGVEAPCAGARARLRVVAHIQEVRSGWARTASRRTRHRSTDRVWVSTVVVCFEHLALARSGRLGALVLH